MSDENDDSPSVIGADIGAMPKPIDYLLSAARSVIDAVDDRIDNAEKPLKYIVPWARLTALRSAVLLFVEGEGAIVAALRAELAGKTEKLTTAADLAVALTRDLSAAKAENERQCGCWADGEFECVTHSKRASDLTALRALLRRWVDNDKHFVPDWDVDGLAADALREYENLVADTQAAIGAKS